MSNIKNLKHKDAFLTELQEQVAIGTLLGDSSLSRPKKNGRSYHLSCYHAQAQLEWLQMKWEWLAPLTRPIQLCQYLDKRDGKVRSGGRFHTISAPCFGDLHDLFYQSGRKAITNELMHRIHHPIALACLICDDGSWDGGGIQIASKQFNESENHILAGRLSEIYGINAYATLDGKYWSVRISAISVKTVFDLCLPFVPQSMYYKFGGGEYVTRLVTKVERICPVCKTTFSVYESSDTKYCSRKCAGIGKPSGYKTRTKIINCAHCGNEFIQYNEKNIHCSPACRDAPAAHEVCQICGNPVKERGRIYCSMRCNVIGGHISRGHTVIAI